MLDYSKSYSAQLNTEQMNRNLDYQYPEVSNTTQLKNGRVRIEYELEGFSHVQDVMPDENGMLHLDLY